MSEQLDPKEWAAYVKKIANCEWPVPVGMIKDYNDWRCRSIVGRMLVILKDVEGAMAVLNTVKDVQPNMEDQPEYGLSEPEHKVLCLRDIAKIVWDLTGTAYAPLTYLQEAYEICRNYKHKFRSADRGGIWYTMLDIKRSCGNEAEAAQEAVAMLAAEQVNEGINPYRFYAYKFLAECAAEREQYDKGVQLIIEAYKSFPCSNATKRDMQEASEIEDPKARYEAYHHCTTIQYQPWEKWPPVVLKRG